MINQQGSPTYLLLCITILLIVSLIVSTWGKRLPGRGSWLIWAGIVILLTGVGVDSGLLLKNSFVTRIWASGWIWARDEPGAITVGMLQDPLGLAMVVLVAVVSGTVLLGQSVLSKNAHLEREMAGLGISTAGVALAWTSLTPWIAFVGQILAILGGFISIGSRWDSALDAKLAAQFLMERSVGFLLAFLGMCVLGTSRVILSLNATELWINQNTVLHSTWLGAVLLLLGLFVQLQPFPFLGLLVSKSEGYLPLRIFMGQVLPAWAVFPLLVRLEPQFHSLGVFPHFGWVAFVSSIATVLAGLFQESWDLMIGIWLSGGFSLSIVLLAFSGPFSAMALFLGVSLAAVSLAGSAASLSTSDPENASNRKKAIWFKAAVFLAAASGTGAVGFVSATGCIRWIAQSLAIPALAAGFLFCFSLYALLGWRLAWKIAHRRASSGSSWVIIFVSFFLLFLSLGGIWTGTITGDVLQGSPDRFMTSLFDHFFGLIHGDILQSENFISVSGLYWGTLVFSALLAYWVSGRKQDRWLILTSFFPKSSQFISGGYGVDLAMERGMEGVEWLGKLTEKLVDEKIWSVWIPKGLISVTHAVSEATHQADVKIYSVLSLILKKLVDLPGKILQLVQTGDLRWYLFFALTSGFAILAHYLKM
jgi:hypothetical protein